MAPRSRAGRHSSRFQVAQPAASARPATAMHTGEVTADTPARMAVAIAFRVATRP